MQKLRELECNGKSGINQNGIEYLYNFEKIYKPNNIKISSISHMSKVIVF